VKVFVTGGNGFVGRPLVRRLLDKGCSVTGAVGPGPGVLSSDATAVHVDLLREDPFSEMDLAEFDAVIHLAAASSSGDAVRDPASTWAVNVLGTVKLLHSLARVVQDGRGDPLLLFVSTGDVYAADTESPQDENSATIAENPYVASKLAAEIAATEVARRTGLKVVIARPFPHSGAGQDTRFVAPDFAAKVLAAKDAGESSIKVGNMNVVRELLHVDDVVDAYVRLVNDGLPGEVYNVARGTAVALTDLLSQICEICEYEVTPVSTTRGDVPVSFLTGNSSKLRNATGWEASVSFEDVVRDVVAGQMEARVLD